MAGLIQKIREDVGSVQKDLGDTSALDGSFEKQQRLAQQQIENLRQSALRQREFADSYTQRRADALDAFRNAASQGMMDARRGASSALAGAIGGAAQTGFGSRYAAGRQAAVDSGNQMASMAAKNALSEAQLGERFLEQQSKARLMSSDAQSKSLAFETELLQASDRKTQEYNARIDELKDKEQGFLFGNATDVAEQVERWAALEGDPKVREWLLNRAQEIRSGKESTSGSFLSWL